MESLSVKDSVEEGAAVGLGLGSDGATPPQVESAAVCCGGTVAVAATVAAPASTATAARPSATDRRMLRADMVHPFRC
ncbi:hypothetical protein A6A07_34465 [Streptomyces sp. CB03911]|nr:hypothetical protein A6A07_34465 [Streptomyces sp. CB03911]